MVEPENSRLFCRLDGETAHATREQQRLKALSDLGLLEAQTIPIFEEATQTAAHILNCPICILGFVDQDRLRVRSAVGLSRLGLMNQLAQERQMPRSESLCAHVVETHQVLEIRDALSNPAFAKSLLVQHYGIRAYLGVPLMDAAGHCLGAIAVMDLQPRTFTNRDIEFLEIIARWSMSEFERNRLLENREMGSNVGDKQLSHSPYSPTAQSPQHPTTPASESPVYPLSSEGTPSPPERVPSPPNTLSTIQVKIELMGQLTQELRTPLTSVLGMASVLSHEIYGPLTSKQKEYIEIIQHSGRYLLSLVNELSELGILDESTQALSADGGSFPRQHSALNLTSVDIEMLCQQVVNTLEETANRREQEIRLLVELGRSRIFILDKDKVRQLLYHLVFSVIQSTTTGSVVCIHASHQSNGLNLAVGVSQPRMGNVLNQIDPSFCQLPVPFVSNYPEAAPYNSDPQSQEQLPVLPILDGQLLDYPLSSSVTRAASSVSSEVGAHGSANLQPNSFKRSRESLRLLLSCHLVELHGGQIYIQGTPESGYRYVVSLPELTAGEESL